MQGKESENKQMVEVLQTVCELSTLSQLVVQLFPDTSLIICKKYVGVFEKIKSQY